ncbi:MAG: hypothetical protein WAU75_05615 [Solirubrobacteraceae bacterium]
MTTTHRITMTALLILSLAAAGAPVASARAVRVEPASVATPTPTAYSRQDKSLISATTLTSTPTTTGNSGFDWLDAAIGAAGGIALSMLGLGGAHGVSQYRTRSQHTAALSG